MQLQTTASRTESSGHSSNGPFLTVDPIPTHGLIIKTRRVRDEKCLYHAVAMSYEATNTDCGHHRYRLFISRHQSCSPASLSAVSSVWQVKRRAESPTDRHGTNGEEGVGQLLALSFI